MAFLYDSEIEIECGEREKEKERKKELEFLSVHDTTLSKARSSDISIKAYNMNLYVSFDVPQHHLIGFEASFFFRLWNIFVLRMLYIWSWKKRRKETEKKKTYTRISNEIAAESKNTKNIFFTNLWIQEDNTKKKLKCLTTTQPFPVSAIFFVFFFF